MDLIDYASHHIKQSEPRNNEEMNGGDQDESHKGRLEPGELQPLSNRSVGQNVLMKSALTAVLESSEGPAWYENGSVPQSPHDKEANLVRLHEMTRSDSCLNTDTKFKKDSLALDDSALPTTFRPRATHSVINKNAGISDGAKKKVSSGQGFKKGHSRSKSDQIGIQRVAAIGEAADKEILTTAAMSSSVPETSATDEDDSDSYFLDENGTIFPKPYEGQSLISYLDSRSYDTGADMDKENAHFSICEALITAIEQMKCNIKNDKEESEDEDDEEIKDLKRKITEHKKRKIMKRLSGEAFSDRSETGRSTNSTLSNSSGESSFATCGSPSDPAITRHSQAGKDILSPSWENLPVLPKRTSSWHELDLKDTITQLEEFEWKKTHSAEAVAKSLLKKFAGRKLPAASELKWMVSKEDAPQNLLPLPNAWPVSPDDASWQPGAEGSRIQNSPSSKIASLPCRLRGNLEWAPPRLQIVFSPHPAEKRKVLLQKQHFRCAGCGLKVSPALATKFRYCDYFGKYFCTSCHQNQVSVTPSRILSKWDFKLYHVSDFAKDLLKRIQSDPLFDVSCTNPSLYKKSKALAMIKELRLKLHHARSFLQTCKLCTNLMDEVIALPSHVVTDPDLYSLIDFIKVRNGSMLVTLKPLVEASLRHITECQLCQAKGYICEYCRNSADILYPFDLKRVSRCEACHSCYHKACFVPDKCAKCERRKARMKLLQESSPPPDIQM